MTLPAAGTAGRRIGFVSTRFSGTDGVSLETDKWAAVLERLGHTCFYFAGYSDRPPERSRVVREAMFMHPAIEAISDLSFLDTQSAADLIEIANPEIQAIYKASFSERIRLPRVTRRIHELSDHLKAAIYEFVRDFGLEVLIVENALAIPMNIPLGLALTEFIGETGIPVIAHHHDFYWERDRYLVNSVADYLSMAFPPVLPSIRHVVISSVAAQQLSVRTGLAAMIIPNVMDFENPPAPPDDYTRDLRQSLGLAEGELLILQPTRVVQRKGIEHAIELVRRAGLNARLVISHASGDEKDDYEQRVREFAAMLAVPVIFVSDIIRNRRGLTPDGRKIYELGDVYQHADLVTYPSSIEGFGNAFLEAVYYRRPIVVNSYSIFDVDIKPKGFRVIEFDGYITEATLRLTRRVLADPGLGGQMTETNYRLAHRHFSYATLKRRLQTLLTDIFGESDDD
jgi:glycosyltransferase involved in cell wall biosynthesis